MNPGKGQDAYKIASGADKIRELEESTLFTFISTNVDNDSRIKNFSCVKIQHVKSQLYLSMKKKALFNVRPKPVDPEEELQEQQLQQQANSTEFQGKLFQELEDEDINHVNRHVIELKQQAGYEDAFFI